MLSVPPWPWTLMLTRRAEPVGDVLFQRHRVGVLGCSGRRCGGAGSGAGADWRCGSGGGRLFPRVAVGFADELFDLTDVQAFLDHLLSRRHGIFNRQQARGRGRR